MKKIFLGHPVTDWTSSDGEFRPSRKALVRRVITTLRDLEFEVMCAAVNEDYGAVDISPSEFTRYDVESLETADAFILMTTERLTRDMYLETGIALARDIPIFFFVPASTRVTYMIHGLVDMNRISITQYDAESELPDLIRAVIGARSHSEEGMDTRPLSQR
jgi:hypothetical protein